MRKALIAHELVPEQQLYLNLSLTASLGPTCSFQVGAF